MLCILTQLTIISTQILKLNFSLPSISLLELIRICIHNVISLFCFYLLFYLVCAPKLSSIFIYIFWLVLFFNRRFFRFLKLPSLSDFNFKLPSFSFSQITPLFHFFYGLAGYYRDGDLGKRGWEV